MISYYCTYEYTSKQFYFSKRGGGHKNLPPSPDSFDFKSEKEKLFDKFLSRKFTIWPHGYYANVLCYLKKNCGTSSLQCRHFLFLFPCFAKVRGRLNLAIEAIKTGMILLIMDIKKLLLCIFSKTYKLWCIEGVLYWCKYPILTFLDKWCHKIVNSIDQGFRQQ